MRTKLLGLLTLLIFAHVTPAYCQDKAKPVTLLQSIEEIKKERIAAQDEFHVIQSKIGTPGARPTLEQLKQYTNAVIRIKNLRYSFGVDANYRRVYFCWSNNQTQNKLGEEEFNKTYSELTGYNLKIEPPFTLKDIDQASLCLRAMYKIVNLKIELNTISDSAIEYKMKSDKLPVVFSPQN